MSTLEPQANAPAGPGLRRRRRVSFVIGALGLLALAAGGGCVWVQQAGWSADAPVVLGISPPPGTRGVAGDAPISIAFNVPMDTASVEASLRVDPPTAGTGHWEGFTYVWQPQPGYRRGLTYTVALDTGARSPLFRALSAPISTTFETAGLPSLYRSVPPAGAANVPTDTMVTLQFSRPMVALSTLDSAPDPSSHVRITPDAGGHWQWLGSTTLAYRAPGLRPATRYAVAVDHTLADNSGGTLDQDYQVSFSTLQPAVFATQPETNTQFVGLHDPVVVHFNQPVDRASAESGMALRPDAGGAALAGTFAWAADSRVFTYTAETALPSDTLLRGTLRDVRPAQGDLAMDPAYTWTFRTTPPARAVEMQPADGATDVTAGHEILVRYSAPLSNTQAELLAGVRIDPAVGNVGAYSYDDGTTLNLFASLAPSTAYTITVGAGGGYRGRDGQPVPAVTWHFRTVRTPPDARVLSSDNLVSYYAGQPTRVFLRAVNVDGFLRMRLWKLSGDELSSYLQLASDKRAQYQPQTAVARTWDIPVNYDLNRVLSLDPVVALDAQADRLPPGLYYLRVSTPQTANSPGTINGTALIVGNAGLIMKQGDHDMWVWAVDMATGRPLAGRTIQIRTQGQAPVTAQTGADGLAHATIPWDRYKGDPLALLNDGTDAGVVAASWNQTIGPWNFDLTIPNRRANDGAALYTDRAIYRPGQTVYFKGIARSDDDGRYALPGSPVTVHLDDPQGHTVYSTTLPLSPFGTFAGQYTLPDYAALGGYYLACRCRSDGGGPSTGLAVQEYRKPEYAVTVTTGRTSYVAGDVITGTARADYFFGGPVAGAQVTTRLLSQDYYFTWRDRVTGASYDFQDADRLNGRQSSFYGELRSETHSTSDAAGQVALHLPASLGTAPVSQLQTIEASVTDDANQQISSNTQVIVHQGRFYIGLRPDSYLGITGQPAQVEVQTVADDGSRYPSAALTVQFFRRVWEQTTEKDESGLDRPAWKPQDTRVDGAVLTTDAQGHGITAFTPAQAGEYRIVADGRDAAGNAIHSATSLYVSDPAPGALAVPWRQENPDIVTLVADKAGYAPGDTAHILVTSPFSQATGLLTIERGHVLSHRVVDLRGPSPIIDVAIDDSYLPNVYLSLSLVAPAGMPGGPGFRLGYLALPVSAASKQLAVTLAPSRTTLGPRDTVTYTIGVRDSAGRPVAAELSLALVDEAIYSLAGDTTPTLMDSFYGVRSLDLNTASSFLVLAGPGTSARTSGGKGGGGGGGTGSFVRSNFSDTAFWRAQVTTGANGQAVVAIRLPDNLTTWRLTALAVTKDTQVGQAINRIVTTRPLLVRPRVPRFLTAGDLFAPAAIVENRTGCSPDADVTLQLDGATFTPGGPANVQHVHLGAQAVIPWQVTAGSGPTATLTFILNGTTCNGTAVAGDSVVVSLPVQPPLTGESVATSGSVDPRGTAAESIFLPHGVDLTRGGLSLQVAPSLAAGATQALNYVKDDQYDSTEQTISRFLPLLQLSKAYSAAGLPPPTQDDVPAIVNGAIVRLYTDQHYDGGWGWFAPAPSDPYLTAYAVEGLVAARAADYDVSPGVLDNAAHYLETWLAAGPQDARAGTPRLETRAYVLYVLAQAGHPHLDLARALAVQTPRLALYGRAYLALAFQHMSAPGDAATLLTDLSGAAKETSTTAHWEEAGPRPASGYLDMDTDARTTALVLQALIAQNPQDALIPRGVRWLMESRRAGHWLSTQETAAVLDTLALYLNVSGELQGSGAWTATLNGAAWGSGSGAPGATVTLQRSLQDLLINQNNALAISRQGATGRLYYTLNLDYNVGAAPVTARSEGLSVIREYVAAATGAGGTPLRQVAVNTLVEVRLTVIAPTDAYYLVVEDPLPAGLEPVDGSLQTTGLTERLQPPVAPAPQGKGQPGQQSATALYFDQVEMHDAQTVLYASYLPAGVYEYRYLARATTPGTYTVLPAQAHLTYLPDIWGRTDSSTFTVIGTP